MHKNDSDKVGKFLAPFIGIWVLFLLLGLGTLGVLTWGFIKLVNHFT